MSYHYDLWGWYDSDVAPGADRSTEIVPPQARGSMRPNWTGHEWVLAEYKAPPPQVEKMPTSTLEERVVAIEKRLEGTWP